MRICVHTATGSARGRAGRSAKHQLLRAVGSATVTAEELLTVPVGVEASWSHGGADSRARVAAVRTSSSAVFRRAVHKLGRCQLVKDGWRPSTGLV